MTYKEYVESTGDYYHTPSGVVAEYNLPPCKSQGGRVQPLTHINNAHTLARMAGLIPSPDELADKIEDEMGPLKDWFLTEGLNTKAGLHPLHGNNDEQHAVDKGKEVAYTKRRTNLMRGTFALRAGARSQLAELRHPEAHKPGFYRWSCDGDSKSSIEFHKDQLKTPRQIAGLLIGTYGKRRVSVIHNANHKRGDTITPVYTAYISRPEPNTFLLAENNWAKACKVVDLTEVEKMAKKIDQRSSALDKVVARHEKEKETSFDEAPIQRWEAIRAAFVKSLESLREDYSAIVAKQSIEADTVEEPCNINLQNTVLMGDLPLSFENVEFMTERDKPEEEIELKCENNFWSWDNKLKRNCHIKCRHKFSVSREAVLEEGESYKCPICENDVSIDNEDMLIHRLLGKPTKKVMVVEEI